MDQEGQDSGPAGKRVFFSQSEQDRVFTKEGKPLVAWSGQDLPIESIFEKLRKRICEIRSLSETKVQWTFEPSSCEKAFREKAIEELGKPSCLFACHLEADDHYTFFVTDQTRMIWKPLNTRTITFQSGYKEKAFPKPRAGGPSPVSTPPKSNLKRASLDEAAHRDQVKVPKTGRTVADITEKQVPEWMGKIRHDYWHSFVKKKEAESRSGINDSNWSEYNNQFALLDLEDGVRMHLPESERTTQAEDELVKVVNEKWPELKNEVRRFPNASERIEVFDSLKRAAGMNVIVSNESGRSLLHYLAMNDAPDLMDPLVSAGMSVDCLDSNQQTPLHLAVLGCCSRAVLELINCGADVHRADFNEMTPWHAVFTVNANTATREEAKLAIMSVLSENTSLDRIRGSPEARNVLMEMQRGKKAVFQ